MSDKESNNYHRLITLVVKTGTRTFREVLKKHTDDDITSVLKKHRNQLKSNRALTDPQYQLLNADTPDLEQFDISLLFILIRNICTTVETPPGNGWETAIVPRSDTTVGGYIIGIRNVRDEVVDHSSDARVSNDLFKKKWAEAETCLKGLAAHVGILDEIDKDIKNTESMHLTTHSNINLEATLMKWRVEELFTKLAQLNEKADGHATNLQTVMDDVSLFRKQIEGDQHTGNSGSANQQTAPDVNKFMLIVNKEMDQTKNVLENKYDGVCKALGIYATQQQQTKSLPPIVNPNALPEEEIDEFSQELDWQYFTRKGSRPSVISDWQYFTRKGSRPSVISGMMANADIVDHWNKSDQMNFIKGIWVMEITEEAIRPFVEKEIAEFPEKPGSDIDLLSTLTVIIHNTCFQRLISAVDMTNRNNIFCQIGSIARYNSPQMFTILNRCEECLLQSALSKGRNVIHQVMQSRWHQLTDHDLKGYCDIFIDIVNQIGTDKAECVRKIEKVRDTPWSITEMDIATEELKKILKKKKIEKESDEGALERAIESHDIFDAIKDLCKSLKDEQGNNVTVVACRNKDAFDLTVISNYREIDKDIIGKQCKEYEQHLRIDIRKMTDEGHRVMSSDVFKDCMESENFFQDMNRINTIISNNSKRLYTDAQHVNSVFFSPVRSVGHMANDHKLFKEPCIVVYVDVKFDKGRVPIDCIEIPRWIEGVRTDVREGMIECLMQRGPTDYNNPVTVGCQISTIQQTGSMGPIIDMGHNKVGFLTSLHVVVPESLYPSCFDGSIDIDKMNDKSVYQPVYTSASGMEKVGDIKFLKGRRGLDSRCESGFEVAVVELLTRQPTDGEFPFQTFDLPDYTTENPMEFTCGQTIDITKQKWRKKIEKCGAITGHTTGTFGGMTPWMKMKMHGQNSRPVEFERQIRILSTTQKKDEFGNICSAPFAKPGDSGSLVLTKENGQLKAVGILTGGNSDKSFCVTPIKPIVDELSTTERWSLKTFQRSNEQ